MEIKHGEVSHGVLDKDHVFETRYIAKRFAIRQIYLPDRYAYFRVFFDYYDLSSGKK